MTHDCTRHPVPVRSCYVHCRCRCEGCRAANRRHARARYRANGGHPDHPMKVDAAPVRAHVARLQADGWSLSEIGRRAGLPPTTVIDLMRAGHPRARQRTATALLAVVPTSVVETAAREGRNLRCVDCGAPSLGGGLRCLPCFQAVATPAAVTGCGTDAGYTAHRRRGETPCQECRHAHAQENARRKVAA